MSQCIRFRERSVLAGIVLLVGLLVALSAPHASAQVGETYSIDFHGPTISVPDSMFGVPITEADLLRVLPAPAPGPLPPPSLWLSGGFPGPAPQGLGLALHPAAIGHPPGVPGFVEVDALSLGLDPQLSADLLLPPGRLRFSVDEFAGGTLAPAAWPTVFSEAAPGVDEAAADVFTNLAAITLPNPPPPPLFGVHAASLDGDGLPSASGYAYPGLGLREPTAPTPPPNLGDNLDALTTVGDPNAVYFSLDSAFPDPHPLAGGFPGSGSALAHGFVGGDILQSAPPAGPPVLWCPAPLLGLDLVGGPDSDDLDALVISENQNGVLDLPQGPDDWVNGRDMILFSLRRGSASVLAGVPDSLLGIPIEEGDVLIPPVAPAFGGNGFPFPGIYIPAESLGLATIRSGTAMPGPPALGFADDLDALNLLSSAIAAPHPSLVAAGYCYCGAGAPCGNPFPFGGCLNVTGAGAVLAATGSSSVVLDDLVLSTTGVPAGQFGIYYMGPAQTLLPFGNGLRCVTGAGGVGVYRYPPQNSGPGGVLTLGPGVVAFTAGTFPPAGTIAAGSLWNLQCWFRDPGGACGASFNFSNAQAVWFVP
jgi:hypothetical protein